MGQSRITLCEARVLGARGKTAEAILKAEQAFKESSTDPIAFCVSSHLRWLLIFLLRAGRFRRALRHLDDARDRLRGGVNAAYASSIIAVAESNLSLRLGRHQEALGRAGTALELSTPFRHHRARLAACIAYLEAVAASRSLEAAGPILEELRSWRDVQIGELRFELLQARALVQRARAREDGSQEDALARGAVAAESGVSDPRDAAWRCFGEPYREAREEAERLDAQLGCGRHVGELDGRMR